MLSFLLSLKAPKLQRPQLFDKSRKPNVSELQSNSPCEFHYFCDGTYDLNGITKLYAKFGATKQGIIDANPGVSLGFLQGLTLIIPIKCEKVLDNNFYMDSSDFTDPTIPKNGSALLSYCYMSFNYKTATKCQKLLKYMRFNADGSVKNSYTIESMCYIKELEDKPSTLDSNQYELRQYTINGRAYYAVAKSDGLYDPGRYVISANPGATYKSTYYEMD